MTQNGASAFDAILIGTGQSGVPLVKTLTQRGWRVAVAESGQLGGSCVNYGCTPTKTLVASARVAHMARRSAEYGIHTGEVTVDFPAVMKRALSVGAASSERIENAFEKNENVTLFRAHAQFESTANGIHRVRVGDQVIEAPRVYLNTGTRAILPPIPGLETVDPMDEHGLLALQTLPRRLIVIGGGYIGLEFAQIFRRLGSAVTLLERGKQIMSKEDADIAKMALDMLRSEGVDIWLNTKVTQAAKNGDDIALTVERDGKTSKLTGSHLLVAIGRTPNSDKLNLDAVGIETDEKGFIKIDDHLQTTLSGVWALGDVNGHGAFTHTSYNDYEIMADNLDGGTRKVSDRFPVYAMFIDPPLARAGMSEKEARASGKNILMAMWLMKDISRAKERSETTGMIKLLVDADTEQFVGAAAFGIESDEWMHTIIALMYAKAPYTVLKNSVPIHPTVAEMLPTILGKLKPLEG